MNPGDTVFVAEWGHGARRGKIVRTYRGEQPGPFGERIVVQLDDQDCPRDCFASSVFANRDAAERSAAGLID